MDRYFKRGEQTLKSVQMLLALHHLLLTMKDMALPPLVLFDLLWVYGTLRKSLTELRDGPARFGSGCLCKAQNVTIPHVSLVITCTYTRITCTWTCTCTRCLDIAALSLSQDEQEPTAPGSSSEFFLAPPACSSWDFRLWCLRYGYHTSCFS